MPTPQPDPWLRGPVPGVAPWLQPSAHALVQAREDIRRFADGLDAQALWAKPGGAASIGFHLFHMASALDRLLAYARGEALSAEQQKDLAREREGLQGSLTAEELIHRVERTIDRALEQFRRTPEADLLTERKVGKAGHPSNVLGLLAHGAEHAFRHAGQIATTAKLVARGRGEG